MDTESNTERWWPSLRNDDGRTWVGDGIAMRLRLSEAKVRGMDRLHQLEFLRHVRRREIRRVSKVSRHEALVYCESFSFALEYLIT
jgi:hypothetical protein